MKKKIASFLAAGALITVMGATSAFAATPAASVPYCTYSNCTLTGEHQHNGTTYAAHTYGDGHTYHNVNHYNGYHRTHNSGGHHR